MAEHGLKGKVVGVALMARDMAVTGTLWGGEFLIADTKGFKRAGHLKQVPLPEGGWLYGSPGDLP